MTSDDRLDRILRLGSDENVGARIKALREARQWSLEKLAEELGRVGHPLNRSSLWKIESGSTKRRVSLREAVAFAKVFSVPVDELFLTEGQLTQREIVVSADRAMELLADAHTAWVHYAQAVGYAQLVLDRAPDRDEAVAELARTRARVERKDRRKAVQLWRHDAARRVERGEQIPDLIKDDDDVLVSDDFARFMRVVSAQPLHPAIDDILSGAFLNADALLPGRSAREDAN